jgi:hypothetical protein
VVGAGLLSCRRQGLPDCHGTGTSVRRCMPQGVRHPDGETDRRSRAAGTPARMIRMPPVSSIWIPGRRWAPAPGLSSGPDPGRRPGPGTPRRSRPPRLRPPGRRRMRLSVASFLFRHHAERRGRSGRTRADPPFCAGVGSMPITTLAVQIWAFCAMSRRARRTLVYVLGSARPGQEAGTNLTNSR